MFIAWDFLSDAIEQVFTADAMLQRNKIKMVALNINLHLKAESVTCEPHIFTS